VDLQQRNAQAFAGARAVADSAPVYDARRGGPVPDYANTRKVALLNGLGLALGDGVVALNAIAWLKQLHPQLEITLYHAERLPPAAHALVALQPQALHALRPLPAPLHAMLADGLVVDLGDFVFWDEFQRLPMVDFFFWALGLDAAAVPREHKQNRWLRAQVWPQTRPDLDAVLDAAPYCLFVPRASSALRSLPPALWPLCIDFLSARYGLRVLGAEPMVHPNYQCIAAHVTSTPAFLRSVAKARCVLSVDSAAVHLAAGFGVPALALFNTIAPALRVASYEGVQALDLRDPALHGLHTSDDAALLEHADAQWRLQLPRALAQLERTKP